MTLQGIDVSWCEQHVPALEQHIVSLLNTEAMREARAAWLHLYEEGIAHMENVRAVEAHLNAERFEWSTDGLRVVIVAATEPGTPAPPLQIQGD